MKAHGLTANVPKTIYINTEQSGRSDPDSTLLQSRIDAAFARPQRLSNRVASLGDYRVCILSGQNTGYAGVLKERVPDVYSNISANVPVTSIERTLIDIAVRPAYSGGITEVLRAYESAKGTASVNRLVAILKSINYVYPYHQAIGYYLERAEYKPSAVDLLRKMPMEFDFYLTHEINSKEYVPQWRLFVPDGF
jgi:predicted transcriptional regulator of viral defense system